MINDAYQQHCNDTFLVCMKQCCMFVPLELSFSCLERNKQGRNFELVALGRSVKPLLYPMERGNIQIAPTWDEIRTRLQMRLKLLMAHVSRDDSSRILWRFYFNLLPAGYQIIPWYKKKKKKKKKKVALNCGAGDGSQIGQWPFSGMLLPWAWVAKLQIAGKSPQPSSKQRFDFTQKSFWFYIAIRLTMITMIVNSL